MQAVYLVGERAQETHHGQWRWNFCLIESLSGRPTQDYQLVSAVLRLSPGPGYVNKRVAITIRRKLECDGRHATERIILADCNDRQKLHLLKRACYNKPRWLFEEGMFSPPINELRQSVGRDRGHLIARQRLHKPVSVQHSSNGRHVGCGSNS